MFRLNFCTCVIFCIVILTPLSLGLECHHCEESTGKDGLTKYNGTCLSPEDGQTLKECGDTAPHHSQHHHHDTTYACETLIFEAGDFYAINRRCTRVARDFKEGCHELDKADVEHEHWIKRLLVAATLNGGSEEEVENAETQICHCDEDGCNDQVHNDGTSVGKLSGAVVISAAAIFVGVFM